MSIQSRFSSYWLTCILAGWICLAADSALALADHCGCKTCQEVHPPAAPPCPCDCGCRPAGKVNCFKKAMDGLKMGFNRLFHFRKPGCDELLCDDACDAAMIDELMMAPPAAYQHSGGMQSEPMDMATPKSVDQPLPPPMEDVKPIAPPVRLEQPPTKPERGSLFDTDDDPFGDDEARIRNYRPIRPSAYEKVELRPIQRQPVPRQSNRRSNSSR